jgi:hypothetical protein
MTSWIGSIATGLAIAAAGPESAAAQEHPWFAAPLDIGLAFLTNLAVHESGHVMIAEGVGADKATLKFFGEDDGVYFLGLSTASGIPDDAVLSYRMGGEIASSYTFEFALRSFRRQPTVYNSALVFFSGTDFFWYSVFAFYLSPREDDRYDPVGVHESTGFSRGTIVAAASTQLVANAWRVFSGTDVVVPSFSYDRQSTMLNLTVRF